MKIVSTNVFVGPNIWAGFPVIRHVVDLGVLEDWPSAKLGDVWIEALVDALPGLREHGCSYREAGGLIRRLREGEGTWLGHVAEHVASRLNCDYLSRNGGVDGSGNGSLVISYELSHLHSIAHLDLRFVGHPYMLYHRLNNILWGSNRSYRRIFGGFCIVRVYTASEFISHKLSPLKNN